MQNLQARAAIKLPSLQHFAVTLGEQIFELNNGDTTYQIKELE